MDVHAPHEPIHSWRDFFIHLITITIGLLIALGLEAGAEAVHHCALRAETRANLRAELQQDERDFPKDLRALEGEATELKGNIALLQRLRAHQKASPGETLKFAWFWNSSSDTAWQTAKETGVLSLMENEQVQQFDGVYSQQGLIDQAALGLTRSMNSAQIPLTIEPDLNGLSPALIDELIRNCAENLNEIGYVQTLSAGMMQQYKDALDKL
jgi:hypothetical protein